MTDHDTTPPGVEPESVEDDDFDPPITTVQERRARVVGLYRQGLTFREVGERMSFSEQRAHKLYWDAMHAVEEREVSAHRAAMIDEIAAVVRVANRVMHKDHVAHSNGRVMVDPETGQKMIDDGPKLDAARTVIAAQARLAKLLGADAPTQVETSSTVTTYSVDLGADGDAAREALT